MKGEREMATGNQGVSPGGILVLTLAVLANKVPGVKDYLRTWVALDRVINVSPDECLQCGYKIPSPDYRLYPHCGYTTSRD